MAELSLIWFWKQKCAHVCIYLFVYTQVEIMQMEQKVNR